MMNDLLSKKFLVFALIWSLILGFAIKGALAMIAYSLVVTPFIENPNMRDHISANTKNLFDSRSFIIIIYM